MHIAPSCTVPPNMGGSPCPNHPPSNGNGGIVPPWLANPIGIYPMPEPPKESTTDGNSQ